MYFAHNNIGQLFIIHTNLFFQSAICMSGCFFQLLHSQNTPCSQSVRNLNCYSVGLQTFSKVGELSELPTLTLSPLFFVLFLVYCTHEDCAQLSHFFSSKFSQPFSACFLNRKIATRERLLLCLFCKIRWNIAIFIHTY
jgi:hypothetical protein